jgi:glutamyl-tRNA reductase
MKLQLIGCSHHQSDVSVREQLAFTEQQIQPFLESFYQQFPQSEAVLLSTCNRTELYVASRSLEFLPSDQQMIGLLAEHRNIEAERIRPNLFTHRDRAAIRHLFSVAASLDSMVIGETQILAQVKRAYQLASASNAQIPLTHHVFQSAIRIARRISNETQIHSTRVSVPSVAIGVLARQIFERLDNKRVLIVGAGEMARETLRYVVAEGGRDLVIVSRNRSRGEPLATEFGGRMADWADLSRELTTADLVISATAAAEPVLTLELFQPIEKARRQKPLFILDLAVPRDVDPRIGDCLNVYLYTLDDLQRECDQNRQARLSQFVKAEMILEEETEKFFTEVSQRAHVGTIQQLKQQADEVKISELKRLFNKLELDPDQQTEIEVAFNRLVNKLLHPPLQSIRDEEEHHSLITALKRLFQLKD